MGDVADAIGESQRTTERLLNLNDLIPTLHGVLRQGGDQVSSGNGTK